MPIVVNLDVMLARRKMRSRELAERIGISEVNLSMLKTGRVKGVRFETLAKICAVLIRPSAQAAPFTSVPIEASSWADTAPRQPMLRAYISACERKV